MRPSTSKNGNGLKQTESTKFITQLSRKDPIPENIPDKVKRYYPNSGQSDWIGSQEGDTKPICYLSGAMGAKGWNEDEFRIKTGAMFRCFSFAYCGFGSPLFQGRHASALDNCLSNGVRVFLDSGAHSFHKLRYYDSHSKGLTSAEKMKKADQLTETFLVAFAKYTRHCYVSERRFDFVVTFDHEKSCPVIFEVTKRLKEQLGIWPIPAYHGDQGIQWVHKYADLGHKLIGVGLHRIGKNTKDTLRRYYSSVLHTCDKLGMKCHGFAVTGDIMFDPDFPFYSVDSTSYLKAAAYGKILDIRPEKQRVALIHVSKTYCKSSQYGTIDALSPETAKYLRDQVESRGFDFDKVRSNQAARTLYNAKVTVEAISNTVKRKATEPWKHVFNPC